MRGCSSLMEPCLHPKQGWVLDSGSFVGTTSVGPGVEVPDCPCHGTLWRKPTGGVRSRCSWVARLSNSARMGSDTLTRGSSWDPQVGKQLGLHRILTGCSLNVAATSGCSYRATRSRELLATYSQNIQIIIYFQRSSKNLKQYI